VTLGSRAKSPAVLGWPRSGAPGAGLVAGWGARRAPAVPPPPPQVLPEGAGVETLMEALCAELPAWLMASTEYWKVEHEGRPVSVTLVVDTVDTCTPFSKTRYWIVQPVGAVDAFHDRLTLLLVRLGEVSPAGTLG